MNAPQDEHSDDTDPVDAAAKPVYCVQRCRKDGTLYGATHGSRTASETTCGINIDDNWWILSNDGSQVPSCNQCSVGLS